MAAAFNDSEKVFAVAVHPERPLLAIGTEANVVKLYNLQTLEYERPLPQVGWVMALDFSPCGTMLATAASSHEQGRFGINIWKASDGGWQLHADDHALAESKENDTADSSKDPHEGEITCVRFRPGEKPCRELVSGSADTTVRMWLFGVEDDERPRRKVERMHTAPIMSVAFDPSGRLMCTVSSAREVHVWVLHERLPITVLQSVSYQLQGEVPYTVCFFEHRHKGFTENDVELFEYRMVVGTEKSLLFFDVRESYANFDLFDPTNSSEFAERKGEVVSQVVNPETNETMMMKRTLTRRTQNRRQFKDKVNPELNFLSVALAQKQSMLRELGGVRSLAMIEFDEPGEHEHRRGCHVVIVGGFGIEQPDGRTLSPVHAVTLNETGGREPFSCHANSLTEHFGLVHSVCGLSKRVRSNLDGFLGDEELLAVSGSFDESVRLTKFSVSLDANEFRAAKKAGDKVLVLERPLTEFQAKRLFALQEAAQSAVTDRPFPQRGDLTVVDAQLKKAAGAAGGVAGLSSLSVFRDTALIGAGQVPAKPVEVKGPQAPRAEHHAQHGHRGHHHGHHGHHGHHEQHGHHKHAAAAPHEGVRGASKLTSFEKFAKKKEEAEKSKQRMCKNTCVVM